MKPLHIIALVAVGWYLHSSKGIDLWTADGWRKLAGLAGMGASSSSGSCCDACAQASQPMQGAPSSPAPPSAAPPMVDPVGTVFAQQAAMNYARSSAGTCAGGAC